MLPFPRIAVVWQGATPAAALCDALALARPGARVCAFGDAVADCDAVRRFRPHLLVAGADTPDAEFGGTLRLLCTMLGDSAVVLATPHAEAAAGGAIARRLGAELLLLPATPAAVAAAVDSALGDATAGEPQALLSLIRGIADEINNPLQAALGQLRLLESELSDDESKLAKVLAATRGLRRIHATIERARAVQRSAQLTGELPAVDLGAILREVAPGTDHPVALVRGDRELLRAALRDLGAVGRDLAGDDSPRYALTRLNGEAVVRLVLAATRLSDWQLPRTFEPYYLSRLLRGTSHGLALFAVQQVFAAHGGTARARRRADGGLTFELSLPTAEVGQTGEE